MASNDHDDQDRQSTNQPLSQSTQNSVCVEQ